MAFNLRPHIQVEGYFGTPGQLGITRNFAANEALDAARSRAGGAPGLGVVGESPSDALKAGLLGTKSPSNPCAQTSETRRAPIALARRAVFSATGNAKGSWAATTIPNAADWEQLPNPFGGSVQGLYYCNANANARALFTGPQLAANAPLVARLYYFKGDFTDSKQIGFIHWGNQTGGIPQWRLENFDGSFSIQRLSASWTQAAQTALETLLCLPSPTDAQTAQIAASRQTLYTSENSLSVSGETFARMIEVKIEADETGSLWCNFGREGEQVVELQDIITTRATGDIWKAGALQIGCNQGAFMWQVGTIKATTKARFYLPSVARMSPDPTGATVSAAYHAPTGTTVTTGLDETEVWDRPYVELTSSGARTPVLHDVFYTAPASPRTPDTDVEFDSDDPANLLPGSTCIASMGLSWGGEMKRLALDLEVMTPNGAINVAGGDQQEFWAERVARFWLGTGSGERLLCAGLIQEPTLANATNAAQGLTLDEISGPQTSLRFKLVDFWQIADEWLLRETPVGDGEILGEYISLLLGFAGFTVAERAGLNSLFGIGPELKKAAPGEKPLIQPAYEQSLGDFLRWLMNEFATGYTLDCYTGVWRLRERNLSPRCAFGSGADPSGLATFKILEPLDIIRDHKDVRTHFCGQGAPATPGAAPVEWKVGALVYGSGEGQRGFQGRIRRQKTTQNDAWRTQEETLAGTRSQVRREAKPGRFFGFKTSFCAHLLGADLLAPGDRVYVSGKASNGDVLDGVLCEIESLSSASIEKGNDSLAIVAREVINFA